MTAPRAFLILLAVLLSIAATPALAHKDHDGPPRPPAAAAHQAMDRDSVAAVEDALTPDPAPPPKGFDERLVDWLGRWHPSIVHFPIALLLVTALLEAASRALKRPTLADAARVTLALAAISGVAAVALGWLAMGFELGKDDQTHELHRWIGSGLGVLVLATWWAREALERRADRGRCLTYAVLLAVTVALTLVNGYLGGVLVHGPRHMAF